MKTEINLTDNKSWNFFKRLAYSLQVLTIAIGIPVLSLMQMTHVEKPEIPSSKTINMPLEKSDVIAFTLK
jgi:hypothetical protein